MKKFLLRMLFVVLLLCGNVYGESEIFIDGIKLANQTGLVEQHINDIVEAIGNKGSHIFQLFSDDIEIIKFKYNLPEDSNFLRISVSGEPLKYRETHFTFLIKASDYTWTGENSIPLANNISFWNVEITRDGNNWLEVSKGRSVEPTRNFRSTESGSSNIKTPTDVRIIDVKNKK